MTLLTTLFSSLTMSKPNPNPNPNLLLQDHVTKNPHQKIQNPNNNGLSFFAFLLSISFYISIFFFFNLSPSSLLHSTKFWFAISNNLVLIIAADYGSFSSSPRNHLDLYDQYVASKSRTAPKKPVLDPCINFQESFEDKEVVSFVSQETKSPGLEIVVRDDPSEGIESFHDSKEVFEAPRKGSKSRTFRRRSSGKEKKRMDVVLRRSESERRERVMNQEEDEFSRMSNEELNKRVEEFIQRFNRQMRLQRANF